MPHLNRRRVVGSVGYFRFIFFAPPSRCPRRAKREKYLGFHSSVPTHPTPGYISHESRGRRARSPGDGSRRGHPGCFPGGPELSRSATSGPQVGPLSGNFGVGMATPMQPRTTPLRAALEPGRPATLSEFQIHGFSVRPQSHLGATSPA
jgi:hypothetical protein